MLLLLFAYLSSIGWKVPTAFTDSSTRMMLAALTALLVTIFLGPRCIKKLYELKTGQSIRVEDCPMLAQLHEKKKNTPTMGGILILFAIFIALLLWMDLTSSFTMIFLVAIFWLGGIGAYDDYLKLKYKNSKGLSARKKFLAQVVFSAAVGIYAMVPGVAEKVEATVGLLLAFIFGLLYLAGNFVLTGTFVTLQGKEANDFSRITISLSILGISTAFLLEPAAENLRKRLGDVITSSAK